MEPRALPDQLSPAAYCREVETYLCRRNGGHLVRIVGPSFELVRGWADAGVPMSLVRRAIDVCSERRESRREASRPLRIEFCESEVRDQFQRWRRAVGPFVGASVEADEDGSRIGLASHLTRASEKLARAAARLDRSDAFRTALDGMVGAVSAVQIESKGARGERRGACVAELAALDRQLMTAAREEAARSGLDAELRAAAAAELTPWRERMPGSAWSEAVQAASDRLLRDRLDLPDLAP
ncbi:MAG: hypothetical protein WD690_02025 [Vicinamibacterales bacterium]